MSLIKQPFPLDFSNKLDTGRDDKLAIPSRFQQLENVEFDKTSTIRQAGGYTDQGPTNLQLIAPLGIRALHTYQEELLLEAGNGLMAAVNGQGFWRNGLIDNNGWDDVLQRPWERSNITYQDIEAPGKTPLWHDVAYDAVNEMECWVFASEDGFTSGYRLIHTPTRTVLSKGPLREGVTTDPLRMPKVVVRTVDGDSTFYIYFILESGGTIGILVQTLAVLLGVPQPLGAVVGVQNLGTTPTDAYGFDAFYSVTNDLIVLGYIDASTTVTLHALDSTGYTDVSVQTTTLDEVITGGTMPMLAETFDAGGAPYALMTYYDGDVLKAFSMLLSGAFTSLKTTLKAVDTTRVLGSFCIRNPFTTNSALVFLTIEHASGDEQNRLIQRLTCAADGSSPSAVKGFATNCGLWGRPFIMTSPAGETVGVTGIFSSQTQATFFVFRLDANSLTSVTSYLPPRILARIQPGVAWVPDEFEGVGPSTFVTPETGTGFDSFYSDYTRIHIPFLRRGKASFATLSGSGSADDLTVGELSCATLSLKPVMGSSLSQRSLLFPGGNPALYDGERIHEAGFNFYPEIQSIAQSDTVPGALTLLATYWVIITYEWTDAHGVLHRSAPSVPKSFTLTGANDTLTITVPNLGLTDKQINEIGFERPVIITAWRTVGNPSGGINALYYREVVDPASTALVRNFLSNANASVVVGAVSDVDLVSHELLYTTGGALENEAFPTTAISCQHQRRTFFATLDNVVQYTDETDERFIAQATNEAYQIRVPTDGGKITSLQSMDDKLVIFCERRIYAIFGEGPNRLGQQSTYSLPQIVSAQLGCKDGYHLATVLSPAGLWFYTENDGGGFRLLTRGLAVAQDPEDPGKFLGGEVDTFVTSDTVGRIVAVEVASKSQIRWYVDKEADGIVLVYNYEQNRWTLLTDHNSTGGAAARQGTFWHASGTKLFQSSNTPGGKFNTLSPETVVTTAWIPTAGILGYQRIYQLQLLGDAITNCLITLNIGYDYEEDYTEDIEFFPFRGIDVATVVRYVQVLYLPGAPVPYSEGSAVSGLTFGTNGTVQYWDAINELLYVQRDTGGDFQVGDTLFDYDTSSSVLIDGTNDDALQVNDFTQMQDDLTPAQILTGQSSLVRATIVEKIGNNIVTLISATGTFEVGETLAVNGRKVLNIEHHLQRQKCTAVRFKITAEAPGLVDEAVRWSAFTLLVGVKKGLNKIPSKLRF